MFNSYWNTERWRLLLVLFIAVLGGMISHFWLASLTLALIGYIGWILFKLRELHHWLKQGANAKRTPENNGIWEQITHQIQSLKKQKSKQKKRAANLLKRSYGIFGALPYANIVLNNYNEIDWSNKKARTLLNIKNKDKGQRIDNLIRLPEIHQMLANDSYDEIEVFLPNNGGRHLAIQLVPVQKNLKLLIARDISDRENIMQMRKTFIANASHELRTPLTVISGYLEILALDERLPDDLLFSVNSASEQTLRMQHIIEDLLTLSRLENTDLSQDSYVIIDMPQILQDISHSAASLINDESHRLTSDIDDSLKIKGAEVEISSVCTNLIHNAIRHTQEGTEIKIEWRLNAKGDACLTVKDNGYGIPSQHLKHLTERFYRVDIGRSRNQGGTGLGLAIVQHIMQRHGGILDIQSTLGQGSSFTAIFPANRVAATNRH